LLLSDEDSALLLNYQICYSISAEEMINQLGYALLGL
jgi:hypothetical protein